MEASEKIDPKKIKWDDLESLKLSESGKIDLRNYLLNQNPAKSWIKKHPIYNIDYLPIDKVEFLLTIFFKTWRVEVKKVFQFANSVCVTIRLYYQDADNNELNWQDGLGAEPLQVNKDANPMDSDAIKSNAVMLSLPKAETNAVKDAADKIGKIFGRDLNRKDTLNYDILVKDENKFNNAKITEK